MTWLFQLLGFVSLLAGMCVYNGISFKACFLSARNLFLRYRHLNEEEVENRAADVPNDDVNP